jgi:uncharacterized membrane protein YcaP (DUF421 family)
MDVILRAAFIFFFVWLILRGMGKRELAQLNAFELVLLIVMGDLIQQAVTLEDHSVVGAMAIISTLAILTVGTSWVSLRSGWFARLFEGQAAPVWKDGAPVERTMRQERIRFEELEAEARKQGIARLEDVHVATLEDDGTISFLRIERDEDEDDDEPRGASPNRPAT